MTQEELKQYYEKELEECEDLWSIFSYDCFAFYIEDLKQKIYSLSNENKNN